MFRRILLPIDPSRPFGGAHRYAVDLAHRFDSHVVATYVIDEHLLGAAGGEAAQTIDEALEWVGRDAIEDFAASHPELKVHKALAYGPTATALFQMVLQTGADVVVVGGYHGGGASLALWGSTVADIVHHVERPVFVVRREEHLPRPGDSIVVPFDGSDHALAILPRILAFAKDLEAHVEFIHIARGRDLKATESVLTRAVAVAKESGVPATTAVLRRSVWRGKWRTILAHAHAIQSPLIALSRLGTTSGRTGRSRTVDHLVAHADLPVWVVRK